MYDNGYVRLTALPTEILLFPQRFASALPPLKGGGGGMFLCVRSFVIQSEAMNLLLFPARFLTTFGMTKGDLNQYSFRLTALKKTKQGNQYPTLAEWG